jgi:hypothetical protein
MGVSQAGDVRAGKALARGAGSAYLGLRGKGGLR